MSGIGDNLEKLFSLAGKEEQIRAAGGCASCHLMNEADKKSIARPFRPSGKSGATSISW